MRKNDEEALALLQHNVKKWYQEEFGEKINEAALSEFLQKTIAERRESFFKKRLNHLTDEDFLVFSSMWEQNGITKEQKHTQEAIQIEGRVAERELQKRASQVAEKSRVAEASKTSSSFKGAGVRRK